MISIQKSDIVINYNAADQNTSFTRVTNTHAERERGNPFNVHERAIEHETTCISFALHYAESLGKGLERTTREPL